MFYFCRERKRGMRRREREEEKEEEEGEEDKQWKYICIFFNLLRNLKVLKFQIFVM